MFHSETKYFRDLPKTIAFWAALTCAIAAFGPAIIQLPRRATTP